MKILSSQPIGIFDSGIGGLTVAHAIRSRMPNESLIYFGDTAHLPYGDKSEAAIQAYSIKIADLLVQKGCKVIVIACNSASSAAYELLKEYIHKNVYIVNVIDPMIEWLASKYQHESIGLIGTRRTVQSDIYGRKLREVAPGVQLHSVATPLLAPMIEEGFVHNKISSDVIHQYLSDPSLQNIKALILGCTHYPLIKSEINEFYGGRVEILDSSEVVATALYRYLQTHNLLTTEAHPHDSFMVSDYTETFEASARLFFRESVALTQNNLWT